MTDPGQGPASALGFFHWLRAVDHKTIDRRYIVTAFVFTAS